MIFLQFNRFVCDSSCILIRVHRSSLDRHVNLNPRPCRRVARHVAPRLSCAHYVKASCCIWCHVQVRIESRWCRVNVKTFRGASCAVCSGCAWCGLIAASSQGNTCVVPCAQLQWPRQLAPSRRALCRIKVKMCVRCRVKVQTCVVSRHGGSVRDTVQYHVVKVKRTCVMPRQRECVRGAAMCSLRLTLLSHLDVCFVCLFAVVVDTIDELFIHYLFHLYSSNNFTFLKHFCVLNRPS